MYYYFNGALYPNDVYAHRIDKNSFHRRYNVESLGKIRNIAKEPLLCDAPTLSQAQKWLIKEKRFYVKVDSLCITSWFYDIDNLKDNESIETYGVYDSFEEALSAGITECLKLLEKDN